MAEMTDGKDGDRKGVFVNIQRNTTSMANADPMFKKTFYNQNKSLEIRGIPRQIIRQFRQIVRPIIL